MASIKARQAEEAKTGDGHGPANQRDLIALAFSQIVEAQETLRQSDVPFAVYMLDAVKIALAKRASTLVDASEALGRNEEEMFNWFKNMDDEETESPEVPPAAN